MTNELFNGTALSKIGTTIIRPPNVTMQTSIVTSGEMAGWRDRHYGNWRQK